MEALNRFDGRGLWEFLESSGIEYAKSDFPWLTADAQPRIMPVMDFSQYLGLRGRGEAIGYLYQSLGRTLTYIGPVLDAEMKYGFNDHTDRHTLWVAQTGIELLSRAGMSFDGSKRMDLVSELLMILVGMTHDIGNLVGRKGHSKYSVEILRQLFTNRQGLEKEWESVEQAVIYHDEPMLKADFKLADGWPLLWALVAADKMHIGRDRVGDKSLRLGPDGSVEADIHIVLNCLVSRAVWYLEGNMFVINLDFSVEQLEEKFSSISHDKGRVWVPAEYQKAFRQEGVPYRETFSKQIKDVYGERLELAGQGIKLLFPWLGGVDVVLSDTDQRGKVGAKSYEIIGIEW